MIEFFFRYILPKKYRRELCKRDLAIIKRRYKFYGPPPDFVREGVREQKQETKDYWRV